MSFWQRFKAGFKHAFAIGIKEELKADEQAVLEKVAKKIKARGLELPAVVFLESTRPMNMIGSQVLVGLQPFADLVVSSTDYETFARALEKRISIDILIRLLDDAKGS